MYETLASFAQIGGTLLFVAAFLLVLVYALWPGQQARFDKAARQPLGSDDPLDSPKEIGQ